MKKSAMLLAAILIVFALTGCGGKTPAPAETAEPEPTSEQTPHTMFRVPPLTLQPIVENAVKHGRNPYAGPFHISIRTRQTGDGSELVIEDDGCGFDPAGESEGHLALNNIRQRLEIMCGGRLTIEPRPGGGTRVTVFVPLAKKA